MRGGSGLDSLKHSRRKASFLALTLRLAGRERFTTERAREAIAGEGKTGVGKNTGLAITQRKRSQSSIAKNRVNPLFSPSDPSYMHAIAVQLID